MRTVYESLDGVIFSSQEACLQHEKERGLTGAEKDIVALNNQLELLNLEELGGAIFETVKFLALKTNAAAIAANSLANSSDLLCPSEPGFFFFDEEENDYKDLVEKVESVKKEHLYFSLALKKLKGK